MRRLVVLGSIAAALTLWANVTAAQNAEWELVRSVSDSYSGSIDLVLIPEHKQQDREYYLEIANRICAARAQCMVNFWTDRDHIPATADMPVSALAVMVATYERHPSYKEPVLHIACRLYPSREVGELMKCGYFPGAKIPWSMPNNAN